MYRFVWDLHHARPAGMTASYPIAAVYRNKTPDAAAVNRSLLTAYNLIQGADVAPTTQALKAANDALAAYAALTGKAPAKPPR